MYFKIKVFDFNEIAVRCWCCCWLFCSIRVNEVLVSPSVGAVEIAKSESERKWHYCSFILSCTVLKWRSVSTTPKGFLTIKVRSF